jgi:ubiquinone/menaquinone biosynthesis C-methylase UbiE
LHTRLATEMAGARDILDAGAGTGYWSQVLARQVPSGRVVALDFSWPYLMRARAAAALSGRVQLVQADLQVTPFRDGSFDGVLCSGVLDTFSDPLPAFREFHRLLRPEGRLVLIIRGKARNTSAMIERSFRTALGLARRLQAKPSQPGGSLDEVWSRTPLLPRLDDAARRCGFRVAATYFGGPVAMATLRPAAAEDLSASDQHAGDDH